MFTGKPPFIIFMQKYEPDLILCHFKTRSIIKCKRCLQRITEDQVLAYCEEEFKIKNFKLHVSQFYFAIIHAFNLPCLYLFRIMWPKIHWTVIVKRITHYPLSPRNKQKKGRCLLVLPEFFGNICFQTFCNIVKCAYFCLGALSFLKATERSRKETKGAPIAQVTMEPNLLTDLKNSGTLPWLSCERLMKGPQGGPGVVASGISDPPPPSHEGNRRAQCWRGHSGRWALLERHLHQRSLLYMAHGD